MLFRVVRQKNLLPELAIIIVTGLLMLIIVVIYAVLLFDISELFWLKETFFRYKRCLSVCKLLISAACRGSERRFAGHKRSLFSFFKRHLEVCG